MALFKPLKPRLVLATHNQGKLAELFAILHEDPLLADLKPTEVVTSGFFGVEPPVEDGTTFAENALIKARALAAATGLPAVADDSGLAVDLMGGSPGILSARWCGHHGDDAANLNLLLGQMGENLDPAHRRAKFVCAAALVTPSGKESVELGEMAGVLALEPRGANGFGYDPIFIPDDQPGSLTAAEMSKEQKNQISHRAQAFKKLTPAIAQALR